MGRSLQLSLSFFVTRENGNIDRTPGRRNVLCNMGIDSMVGRAADAVLSPPDCGLGSAGVVLVVGALRAATGMDCFVGRADFILGRIFQGQARGKRGPGLRMEDQLPARWPSRASTFCLRPC